MINRLSALVFNHPVSSVHTEVHRYVAVPLNELTELLLQGKWKIWQMLFHLLQRRIYIRTIKMNHFSSIH